MVLKCTFGTDVDWKSGFDSVIISAPLTLTAVAGSSQFLPTRLSIEWIDTDCLSSWFESFLFPLL